MQAWDECDVETMVAMLTADHTFEMPPFARWRRSRDAVEAFLPAPPAGRWRLVPTRANGQLAFGAYQWDPRAPGHRAAVLDVLTLRDERIARVTAFATPEIFGRFGLPDLLPPEGRESRAVRERR
jgi:RNA polymerase sigma-70 factor (ECF subfamily)